MTLNYTPINPSGTAPSFTITVLVPTNLYEVQQLLSNNDTRLPNADYLAKGVVPCVVNLNLTLLTTDPVAFQAQSLVPLQTDLFNYINTLGVGQAIAVSQIISICHKYPTVLQVRLPIVLTGVVIVPVYENEESQLIDFTVTLDGTDTLSIPDLTKYGANSNNTAFFTNYQNSNAQENINIQFE